MLDVGVAVSKTAGREFESLCPCYFPRRFVEMVCSTQSLTDKQVNQTQLRDDSLGFVALDAYNPSCVFQPFR